MKKCPDCEKDIDKLGVSCEYCGRLPQDEQTTKKEKFLNQHGSKSSPKIKTK